MTTMSKFDDIDRKLEKIAKLKEKKIAKRYATLLKEINNLLADSYAKHSIDGYLTYSEMAKHNRLEKLLKQVNKQINQSETGLRNEIQGHLKSQFEDSYYQTAFAIETSSQAKLAYTTVKDEVIDKAINNKFTGLTLNERLSRRRGELVVKMRESITRGLVDGSTYKSMANVIKDDLEGDLVKANRIVRTESRRIRQEASFESAMHAKEKGIIMTKTWICVGDERSRQDHVDLDGETIEIDEKFTLNGREADHPMDRNLLAKDVINCRCDIVKDIARVEKPQHEEMADLTYAEWQKERLK